MNATDKGTTVCPIYGNSAEKGFIRGSGKAYSIAWYPGEPTWENRLKAGFSTPGISIGNLGLFFGAWADAIYYKSCQRVVLEATDVRKKYYPYLKER